MQYPAIGVGHLTIPAHLRQSTSNFRWYQEAFMREMYAVTVINTRQMRLVCSRALITVYERAPAL